MKDLFFYCFLILSLYIQDKCQFLKKIFKNQYETPLIDKEI